MVTCAVCTAATHQAGVIFNGTRLLGHMLVYLRWLEMRSRIEKASMLAWFAVYSCVCVGVRRHSACLHPSLAQALALSLSPHLCLYLYL